MANSKEPLMQTMLYRVWLCAIFLQSVWLLVLYSGWLINSGLLNAYVELIGTSGKSPEVTYDLPDLIAQPLAVAVVIAMIILTIFILSRAPKTSAHMTVAATTKVSHTLEPVVKRAVPKHSTLHRPWYVRTLTRLLMSGVVFALTIPMHFVTNDISAVVLWTVSLALFAAAIGSLVSSAGIKRLS